MTYDSIEQPVVARVDEPLVLENPLPEYSLTLESQPDAADLVP